jgi:hypothetical protein
MMLPKYLDAGTGSAIWAAITAGVAGGFVVIKIFWFRFIKFIKRILNISGRK